MAYSYTERKRIRKSFGSRESVLEVPYLLQMQKDAYTSFLQAGVASNKRAHEGLQAAFESAFPIVSHNGFVEMKFLEYNLAKPAFDVRECQTRGLTFASAVRARVQMIFYDRDSSTSQSKVVKEVREKILPELSAKYPGITSELEGNTQDEADAMVDLSMAAVFALFCIYGLMAVPLKSYSQPLIIMSVIPFGLVGAVLGHMALGLSMSIMSVFGLVALAGVVVNDSLIMVDFVNRAREEGIRVKQAVVDAGTQRFRAILLTSLTTFVGLAPIVLERSLQAKVVVPMAVSLAFGILFATVITLILIPALYVILDDVQGLFRRKQPEVTEATVAE